MSDPTKLNLFESPDFGNSYGVNSSVVKLLDAVDLNTGVYSAHPEYSQLQAWNYDMSLIMLTAEGTSNGGFYIVDATDGDFTKLLKLDAFAAGGGQPRWSRKSGEGNIVYYIDAYDAQLRKLTINTTTWADTDSLVKDWSGSYDRICDEQECWESTTTDDTGDLWVAIYAEADVCHYSTSTSCTPVNGYDTSACSGYGEGECGIVEVFAYNITDDTASSSELTLPAARNYRCTASETPYACCTGNDTGTCASGIDWVAISPSADYVLTAFDKISSATADNYYFGLTAWNSSDMSYAGKVHADGYAHSDTIEDSSGNEWVVSDNSDVDYGCTLNGLTKARIPNGYSGTDGTCADGESKNLTVRLLETPANVSMHISCTNYLFGDYCAVSTFEDATAYATGWEEYDDEIYKLYLTSTSASPVVDRLAHHHSHAIAISARGGDEASCSCSDYYSQPHATLSPDGTMALFGSNWETICTSGSCISNTPVDPFIVSTIPGLNPLTHGYGRGHDSGSVGSGGEWREATVEDYDSDGSSWSGDTSRTLQGGFSGMWYAEEYACILDWGGGGHDNSVNTSLHPGVRNDVWRFKVGVQEWHMDYAADSYTTYPWCSTFDPVSGCSYQGASGLDYCSSGTSYCNSDCTEENMAHCAPDSEWDTIGSTSADNPWTSHSYDQAAWDSYNDRLLFFGPNYAFSDTGGEYYAAPSSWAYDPGTKTWALLHATQPNMTHQTAASEFDPDNNMWVIVGKGPWYKPGFGYAKTTDGRALDVTTNSWEDITNPTPTLLDAVLVYDTKRDRMLVYGQDYSPTTNLYAYEYASGAGTWTLLSPTGGPPNSGAPNAAYDTHNEVMLIYGSSDEGSANPTWIYTPPASGSGGTWTAMSCTTEPVSGDTTGTGSKTNYDPINNLFWYTGDTDADDNTDAWYYRYAVSDVSGDGDGGGVGGGGIAAGHKIQGGSVSGGSIQ